MATSVWLIDPAHSQIEFVVKYAMLTNVRGRFAKFSGEFDLDDEHPERSSGEVKIDAASITTGNDMRDGHLRTPDFFDLENHPEISFKSTRITGKGDIYKIVGDLTIRGVTQEVTLDAEYNGQYGDAYGNTRRGLTIKGTINRKDFGVNWNVALEAGGFLVSDNVKLEIDAQFLTKEAVEKMMAARAASKS
jgi:polyisoprenoid-binding protein YceI